MTKKRKQPIVYTGLLLLVMLVGIAVTRLREKTPPAEGELKVHFIDVGQADCILVQSNGENMLIDAGNNDDGDLVVAYLKKVGVTTLNYAVGTHPHEDHIGGLDVVLQNFPVDHLMMPKISHTTKTFEDVLDVATDQSLSIQAPKQGDSFTLGNATVTAVNCLTPKQGDLNNASIMLRLDFGETSFLFTGDAEEEAEQAVLQSKVDISCTVLKVGHHGSSSSSTPAFLSAVNPRYAVIMCGRDNDYGHPHKEVKNNLEKRNITVYRTDKQGTVTVVSDGKNLTWDTSL